MEIQEIEVHRTNIAVLFDNRSSATLVTHKFAEEVGLKGEKGDLLLEGCRPGVCGEANHDV